MVLMCSFLFRMKMMDWLGIRPQNLVLDTSPSSTIGTLTGM